jgi:hypothetical protein
MLIQNRLTHPQTATQFFGAVNPKSVFKSFDAFSSPSLLRCALLEASFNGNPFSFTPTLLCERGTPETSRENFSQNLKSKIA